MFLTILQEDLETSQRYLYLATEYLTQAANVALDKGYEVSSWPFGCARRDWYEIVVQV